MRRTTTWVLGMLAVVALATVTGAGRAEARPRPLPTLVVHTAPSLPGATFTIDGRSFVAGTDGVARIVIPDWTNLGGRLRVGGVTGPGMQARFSRWFFLPTRTYKTSRDFHATAAFDIFYPVRVSFVEPTGQKIDPAKISRVVLQSTIGDTAQYTGERLRNPVWLWALRVEPAQLSKRPYLVPIEYSVRSVQYSVRSVDLHGVELVYEGQQSFGPSTRGSVKITLRFYAARFTARDALFGFPTGSSIVLRYPDGHQERHAMRAGHEVTVPSLPPGQYGVAAHGLGLPVASSVTLTRAQTVDLKLISWLDLAVVGLAAIVFVAGLPLLARRVLRPRRTRHDEPSQKLAADERPPARPPASARRQAP